MSPVARPDEPTADDTVDDDGAMEDPQTPAGANAPAGTDAPPDPGESDPLRDAQDRLLEAQRVFYATPHAQRTRPDLVEAVESAKDDVRAAMARSGHQTG